MLQRAETVRAEVEREAKTKRKAISSISDGPAAGPSGPRGRGKQASDA